MLAGCATQAKIATSAHGSVRAAKVSDLEGIERLCEQRRIVYERKQPVYFRQASDAREKHLFYLRDQLEARKQLMLVYDENGMVRGFLMANFVNPPPIYNPGGPACMIDDFVVDDGLHWPTIGGALLEAVERRGTQQGASEIIAVCGDADAPKREFLRDHGLTIASNWYTKPLR